MTSQSIASSECSVTSGTKQSLPRLAEGFIINPADHNMPRSPPDDADEFFSLSSPPHAFVPISPLEPCLQLSSPILPTPSKRGTSQCKHLIATAEQTEHLAYSQVGDSNTCLVVPALLPLNDLQSLSVNSLIRIREPEKINVNCLFQRSSHCKVRAVVSRHKNSTWSRYWLVPSKTFYCFLPETRNMLVVIFAAHCSSDDDLFLSINNDVTNNEVSLIGC